jgi:hypothetical protein
MATTRLISGNSIVLRNAVTDYYWPYVTLLLQGEGSSSGNNNVFVDSGPNAFTVTRNNTPSLCSITPFGNTGGNGYLVAPTKI